MIGAEAVQHDRVDTVFWHGAYEEHGPSILAFLTSRSRSRADAEELLQETFVRAIRAGRSLRDRTKVRSFLFTTAHNLLRTHSKRSQLGPVLVERVPEAESPDSADDRALTSELEGRLEEILAAMKPAHRDAFRLGVLERKPYKEIADTFGWSLSAVKVNVFRARRQVLEELGDLLPGHGGPS